MVTSELNQFAIRSFSLETDISGILALRTAVEAVDQEGIEISEETLRAQLYLPGHNPHTDRWVVDAPTGQPSLAASALIRVAPGASIADANILVHPNWRQRGIGSALLTRVIERAHQLKAVAIQVYVNGKLAAAKGFVQKHGFSLLGAYTELRLIEGTRLPPVIWPYGYTVRTYAEVQNLTILTEAMNLSYIPLWGHQEVSEKEMASWLPDFNQQGLFLVFSEKGRVVGISRVELSAERTQKNGKPTGYIDAPGVVPQHRRLDLYRALVLSGIRWLYDQDQKIVEMESWGDKLEVLKMYRELGFTDMRQLVCYQLDLATGEKSRIPDSP